MSKTPKRFIAERFCPKCGEMDKLVMFRDENQTRRKCVNCGYQDSLEDGFIQRNSYPRNSKAKINQVDVQPLKFFDLPNSLTFAAERSKYW